MIASNNASSSENEVSIGQASSGICERSSRHTVTPFPSGRRTSPFGTFPARHTAPHRQTIRTSLAGLVSG